MPVLLVRDGVVYIPLLLVDEGTPLFTVPLLVAPLFTALPRELSIPDELL